MTTPSLNIIVYIDCYDEFSEIVSYIRAVDDVYFSWRSRFCSTAFAIGLLRNEEKRRGRHI
jgi:hypothetical protein